MKLYATIENEKGKQAKIGGNEYLDIDIRVGNDLLVALTLRKAGDMTGDWVLYDDADQEMCRIEGKTQKDERRCPYGTLNCPLEKPHAPCITE